MIKQAIRNHFFGRTRYQSFWKRLHGWTLTGMNMSGDGSVGDGEIWVLDYVKARSGRESPVVVFDVGANVGQYSAEVIRCFGNNLRLYAFEPSKAAYELLIRAISTDHTVECLNFGLGDRNTAATLYSFAGQSGLSSVYDRLQFRSNGNHQNRMAEQVELRSLDSFCHERNIEKISLLKLDVEGHELKVLEGAKRLINSNAIDFIQFEFGGTNVDSRTFLRDFFGVLLSKYSIHRILRNGICSIEPYAETNEIFLYSNYLAVSHQVR